MPSSDICNWFFKLLSSPTPPLTNVPAMNSFRALTQTVSEKDIKKKLYFFFPKISVTETITQELQCIQLKNNVKSKKKKFVGGVQNLK